MPPDEAKWMKLCSHNQTPSPDLPVMLKVSLGQRGQKKIPEKRGKMNSCCFNEKHLNAEEKREAPERNI